MTVAGNTKETRSKLKAWTVQFKEIDGSGATSEDRFIWLRRNSINIKEVTETDKETGKSKTYERWIYVFTIDLRGAHLQGELRVKTKGKLESVNWSDPSKWANKDTRATSRTSDKFVMFLPEQREDWPLVKVFLSEIQLPWKRLVKYLSKPELLVPRCKETYEEIDQKSKAMVICLINYLGLARILQRRYLDNRQNLEQKAGDPDRAAKIQLTSLTDSIVNSYAEKDSDVFDWVRWNDLRDFLFTTEHNFERLQMIDDLLAFRKKYLLSDDGFNETQHDYDGTKVLQDRIIDESAFLIKDSHKSEHGREYLKSIVGKETNWYSKLLLDDNLFSTGKQVFSTTTGTADSFLTIYEQWTMAAMRNESKAMALMKRYKKLDLTSKRQFLQETVNILERRFTDLESEFGKVSAGKFFEAVETGENMPNTVRFVLKQELKSGIEDYNKLDVRLKDYKGKLSYVTARIAFVVNIVNLGNTWMKFDEARKKGNPWEITTESLNLSSACLNMISGASFLLEKKLGAKPFQIIGAIASAIDYASDLSSISRNVYGEKYKAAVGYGLSAVGNACLAIGAVYGIKALAATGTAAAAGLTGAAAWWTGIGLLIALGAIIYLLCIQESPIEKWLKASPWGIEYKGPGDIAAPNFPTDKVQAAIRELYDLIATFEVRAFSIGTTGIEFSVMPGLLMKASKLIIDYEIEVDGNPILAKRNWNILDPKTDPKLLIMKDDKTDRITRIARIWSGKELQAISKAKVYDLKVSAQLDLLGDSTSMVPSSGKIQAKARVDTTPVENYLGPGKY